MKKPAVTGSRTQDTSGLSRQCSATEPRQPDDHQSHIWQPLSMCRQNSIRGRPENSLHQERTTENSPTENSLTMGSFLMERIFRSTPNGVLTAHTEWLPDVRLQGRREDGRGPGQIQKAGPMIVGGGLGAHPQRKF